MSQSQLREMMEGFEKTQLLYVAARLGIPSALAHGSMDVHALSLQTGVAAPLLYRLMRGLAWCGLVLHEDDDSFSLTSLGALLRPEVDGSLYERALCIGEIEYPAWGALLFSVQSGQPAFDRVFGRKFYDYLREQPEAGTCFDRMMGKGAVPVAQSVVEAYDFSAMETLVDLGGSDGTMISTIMRAHPQMRGVIFDLPSVIERTARDLQASELADRLQTVGGDFFDAVPGGADAYILKWILHNWDDHKSVRLLENCRRAMRQAARLLVLEQVMPERVDTSTETVGWDLGMLVHLGSSERTANEFREIFQRAGFELHRVLPTSCGMSILEGVPA